MKIANTVKICSTLMAVVGLTVLSQASRADGIKWSGLYRAEGYAINDPQLDNSVAKSKDYGVQTLILRPEFVAADGLYIFSQFNIMNSNVGGNNLGAVFGDGIGSDKGNTTGSATGSYSATSTYEKSEQFVVTEFYLKMVQDFGDLFVGRMPVNFGLGMSYSDGDGLFDHYVDTRDAVAYKVNIGNIYLMPMFGKVDEGGISSPDDISEWDLQAQYDNPDSNSSIGVYYQDRMASPAGNDTPQFAVSTSAQPTTVQADRMDIKNISVFFKKKTNTYSAGFEACQQSGTFGVDNSKGNNVKLSGFGAIAEYEYSPRLDNWSYGVKAGYATGDDPKTDDQYEGFIFNRNYDVAMLLFNQPLGQADLLHTALYGRQDAVGNQGSAPNSATSTAYSADTEALSNVYYLSPHVSRKFGERWSGIATLTGAWLNNTTVVEGDPTNGTLQYYNTSSDLGYELDLTANYKISKNIMWQNELGAMLPGQAWKVNGQFKANMAYGLVSRAAVSF